MRPAFSRAHDARALPLSSISPLLREAVVATEHARYCHPGGLDLIGLLRAIPYDASHFAFAQGASTIEEHVAKVLYLGDYDRSPWRKLEDAATASRFLTPTSTSSTSARDATAPLRQAATTSAFPADRLDQGTARSGPAN